MLYPPSFLERLRSHFMLSELIGRRMPLKKHGKEYQGLCPFHGEKTPSFTVNNEKNFFHCFGCAAHGDGIEFVKRFERLTYRETIEKLAREAGLPLPEITPEQARREQSAKTLQDAMEVAAQWFRAQLAADGQFSARDYLRERGLTDATQAQFRLGFAPDGRDALKRHLLAQGISEAMAAECGLIIKPEQGVAYDRFRGRIMFPIRNPAGKVIAFGGRLTASSTVQAAKHLPKYLNSPETPLFHKSEVLFNLDQAGKFARERDEIIIVEGYMDAIMMVQAGIPQTVATLGTAVTAEHLQKLWQYAPEPILCLDGDGAGLRAMLRAAELVLPLLKPGRSLRFALLPKGEDPDSLIRGQGVEVLKAALLEARGLSETLWKQLSARVGASAEARAELEHKLMALAERITDATVKSHTRAYFRAQVWNSAPAKTAKGKPVEKRLRSVEVEQRARETPQEVRVKTVRLLFKLLLLQPALLESGAVEEYVLHMDCINPALERLRQGMLAACGEGAGQSHASLVAHLEAQGFAMVLGSLLKDEGIIVPKAVAHSLPGARAVWEDMVHEERVKSLEAEHHRLSQSELDEAGYARFLALQGELKALKSKIKASKNEVPQE